MSTTYGVIEDYDEGSTFEFNAFGSAYTADDADISDENNEKNGIIAILVICAVGCVIAGLVGYCCAWKKYKNVKFDRNDENKMISKEKQDSSEEKEMSEIEIDVEMEVVETGKKADGIITNE